MPRNSKEKDRAYFVARRDRRKAWLYTLKRFPCSDCRGVFPPYIMHFDHREPKRKAFNIGMAYRSFNLQKLKREIAKCDLVCANCHGIRTYKRRINHDNNTSQAA